MSVLFKHVLHYIVWLTVASLSTFTSSLDEFYHIFENSEMKWKQVCPLN